jgi:ribonuclease HII
MSILGIDEVGRGPLAGPLVIGAVILPVTEKPWFSDLKDSKKLTAKKRETLNEIILKESTTGLGWVSSQELDELGITNSLKLATRRAVKQIQEMRTPFSQIIIDGTINFLADTPLQNHTSTLIKADNKIREVSAASIIAKVARDNYMKSLAKKYPNYGFEKHVGYGTAAHIKAIHEFGLCPEHRLSFEPCKTLSGFAPQKSTKKDTTKVGNQGEEAVVNFLIKNGHEIIARNHKTYFYEIDIISTKNHEIYFTEVKYRKSSIHGNGLEVITKEKQNQMQYAAESFLKYKSKEFKNHNPHLAAAAVTGENFTVEDWFPL